MPRVVHFEIAVDDPERAAAFYQEVFGWHNHRWEGSEDYWLLQTGEGEPGIDGALMRRSDALPPTVNIIDVASLDDTLAAVVAGGGRVLRPRSTVPGVGHTAYCQDTEGNAFGLIQNDPDTS